MKKNKQRNRGRMVLLLIAGIPVIVILLATWLWFFVVRGELDIVGALGTANRGSLVQPARQIGQAPLYEQEGKRFNFALLPAKWTLLIPVFGPTCDALCEHKLYETRQIHVAMGKEFARLRRLYVSDAKVADTRLNVPQSSDQHATGDNFAQFLHAEHRGVRAVYADKIALTDLLPEYSRDPATWYLVDPAGWIMMSYNANVSYKDVMADLKFLLKNSSE